MATTKTPPTPGAQTLAQIRAAAVQSGFFKKIFTGGNAFTTAELTMELRQVLQLAGVKLPTEALVTLDSIQIVLAGGAFISDASSGVGFLAATGQGASLLADGAVGLAGVSQLLTDIGLLDHTTSDVIGLGVNAALVITSGGANILADIGLVVSLFSCTVDLITSASGNQQASQALASQAMLAGLRSYINQTIQPQYNYAATQLAAYKNGTANYFDVIGNIALQSPYAFKSFFPGLAVYFPTWMTEVVSVTGFGVTSGWLDSDVETRTVSQKFTKLVATKQQVESTLFNVALAKPLQAFESYFSISEGISLPAVTTLIMLLSMTARGALTGIGTNLNVLGSCIRLGITPTVLGDDWVFKGFLKNETVPSNWKETLPYQPLTEPYIPAPTISNTIINGRPATSPTSQAQQDAHDALIQRQLLMQSLDEAGDMESLIQIPEAYARLVQWASLKQSTSFGQSAAETAILNSVAAVGAVTPKTLDFSDYWKALGVAKTMQEANLFADEVNLILDFGNYDAILEGVNRAYTFVLLKALNKLAKLNISRGTGITVNRLQSRTDTQGLTTYYQGS